MSLTTLRNLLFSGRNIFQPFANQYEYLHTATNLAKSYDQTVRGKWLSYNDKIYEPQKPDEEPRPAVSKSLSNRF